MLRRRVLKEMSEDSPINNNGHKYVDLQLPSGALWAKCNVGALSETQIGNYYQWGGTTEYQNEDQYYNGASEGQILPIERDIAHIRMGGDWRIASYDNYQELIDNTTFSWVTINGVSGGKFSKIINGREVYVFFPASGRYAPSGVFADANKSYMFTSQRSANSNALYARCDLPDGAVIYGTNIRGGLTIRGVIMPDSLFVDLYLPSGKRWAKGNICKDSLGEYYIGLPYEYGSYFAWADITGYNEGEGHNFSWNVYSRTVVNGTNINSISTDITPNSGFDAAMERLDGTCRMPSGDEFNELYNNTNHEWVSDYEGSGVNGLKLISKIDSSKFIFMPASGYYGGTTMYNRSGMCFCWTSNVGIALIAKSASFTLNTRDRMYGYNIRPICD